jgi:hypothetical protein
MKILKFFATLFVVVFCLPVLADCVQECDAAYEECKAAHDSPNGTKVCGGDYTDCKYQCSDNGK